MDTVQLKNLLENLNATLESVHVRLSALEGGGKPAELETEATTSEEMEPEETLEDDLESIPEKVKEGEGDSGKLQEQQDEDLTPEVQTITLDIDTYNELKRAADAGWQASEEAREKQLAEEVDNWVQDGRISASTRGRALKLIHENPELARETFGANPVNTIPRRESGHAHEVPDNGGKRDRVESFKHADMAGLFPSVKF